MGRDALDNPAVVRVHDAASPAAAHAADSPEAVDPKRHADGQAAADPTLQDGRAAAEDTTPAAADRRSLFFLL